MSHAENGGVRIHYQVRGEGPPLVTLHGFGGSVEGWNRHLATVLAAALLFAGNQSPVGSSQIHVLQAVYYTGAARQFVPAWLPWVKPEQN